MKRRGPWSAEQARTFLEKTRVPVRLACNGADGSPRLLSLWFAPEGDRLWCATQKRSLLVRRLREDPRCAFEVAGDLPPYRGVRGRGEARLHDDRGEKVLLRLIHRYLDDPDSEFARWLLGRARDEVAIEIEPSALSTWDYSGRMGPGK